MNTFTNMFLAMLFLAIIVAFCCITFSADLPTDYRVGAAVCAVVVLFMGVGIMGRKLKP